jgi:hypothetical protein
VTELLRFHTEDGAAVLVEVDEDSPGIQRAARGDGNISEAGQRLEQAIEQVRPAIAAVSRLVRQMAPDAHEVEFGIKLSAEVGAVVAKTTAEGHFMVRLQWKGRESDQSG